MPHVIYPGPNVAEEVGKGRTLHPEVGILEPGRNFVRDQALADRLIDSGLCARDPESPMPTAPTSDGAADQDQKAEVAGEQPQATAGPAAETKTEKPAPAGENEPRAKRGGR